MRDTLIDQLKKKEGKRNAFQEKAKVSVRQKQENEVFFILYPKQQVFGGCCFLFFFSLMDLQPLQPRLITQHVYPAFGYGGNNLVFYAQSISTVISG